MKREAFALLHDHEDSWWYRGRAEVVRSVLSRRVMKPAAILDFGAGHGGMFKYLENLGDVYAFEPDAEARGNARGKKYKEVFPTEGEALMRNYAVIGLFDVLEHIQNDKGFLKRARTALKNDGFIQLTVPAMPYLWSVHDVSHHHFRRYTKTSLRRVLEDAGFTVEYISYWNALLFMPAAIFRLVGRGSGESSFALPRALDALLYALIRVESFVLRYIPLPFGVSLVVLARKTA